MATVGNIKAKMVLETAEYMAAADKIVNRGNRMGRELEKALNNAGKSFGQLFGKGVIGLVGGTGVATVMRELAEATADVATHGSAAAAAYAGIENGLAEIGKSIPIISDLYQVTVDLMNVELRMQEAAERRATEMAAGLEKGLALTHEQRLMQEIGLKQFVEMEEVEKRVALLRMQQRDATKGLREQFQALHKEMLASGNRTVMFEGQKLNYQQLRDLVVQREAAIRNSYDAEIEGVRKLAEERKKAEQARTDAWKLEQMQRAMAEQEELEAIGRAGLAAQMAKAQAEATAAAQRSMEFSNVESLSTAIGGVKVAGMSSNSIERLVPTQEMIKNYSEQIARNTQRMAGAGAP